MSPRLRALPLVLTTLMALTGAASADVLIQVDKTTQSMVVTVDGEHLYTWPVSTGKAGHDTPRGDYKPLWMKVDHRSKEWDDAPMPNSIFFTDRGHAIHGSGAVRNLGHAASHGCVRLSEKNSAILFEVVKAEGIGRTKVVIAGEDIVVAKKETAPATRRVARVERPRSTAYSDDETYAPASAYGRSRYEPPAYRESYRSYDTYETYRRRSSYEDDSY